MNEFGARIKNVMVNSFYECRSSKITSPSIPRLANDSETRRMTDASRQFPMSLATYHLSRRVDRRGWEGRQT